MPGTPAFTRHSFPWPHRFLDSADYACNLTGNAELECQCLFAIKDQEFFSALAGRFALLCRPAVQGIKQQLEGPVWLCLALHSETQQDHFTLL